ncbi:hypothetical protein H181DRAFT_00222 [Streptomyces sp. WMMB 714]|nr:hypothetical protein H181DRAFT_00222 [Streptomyces sp. WMMB 714]
MTVAEQYLAVEVDDADHRVREPLRRRTADHDIVFRPRFELL